MKRFRIIAPCAVFTSSFLFAGLELAILTTHAQPAVAKPDAQAAVTLAEDGRNWTLDNRIVKAVINKRNGDLESLVYRGVDTMGHDQGRAGYWEQDPSNTAKVGGLSQSVTIDPAKNGGQ